MSNLIKSVYFNNVSEGMKRVIDSDSRIEEFIPQIYSQQRSDEFETFEFKQISLESSETEGAESGQTGFHDGLNIVNMDNVLDEERQKLSEEASAKSEELLAQAREQADEIVAQANIMADNIRSQALEEGKNQGIEEGRIQALRMFEEEKAALQQEYETRFNELKELEKNLEPRFADIVAELIHKITGVLCEDKKDVIVHLIDNAMNNIERTKQIVLRVSKNDMAFVSSKRSELAKKLKEDTEFEIIEDVSLSENQCIIETDNKIIDCSLDAQLDSLCEQIKMLAM